MLAITPFNFPLNLVAHKVAPALAAGNPVLVKPASRTPLSALALAALLAEDDWPEGAISRCCRSSGERASRIAADPRVRGITFTGSDAVGWDLKAANPRKKVTLELGGNAAVLVEPDADVELAAERLTFGAFAFAGQVCISTQRILVAEPVADEFLAALRPAGAGGCGAGDPLDERTDLRADDLGGEVARVADVGGARRAPAAPRSSPAASATARSTRRPCSTACRTTRAAGRTRCSARSSASSATRASTTASGSPTGRATGCRRRSSRATSRPRCARSRSIDAGSVIVNESPFYRAVQQPYGGARDSGFGREGVSSAMEEMTEPRLLVLPTPGA